MVDRDIVKTMTDMCGWRGTCQIIYKKLGFL